MTTFEQLGLNTQIINSLNDLGFTKPSPIQEKAIPFILNSTKDLIALAQTGTGKTAAFALPILNQIKAGGEDLQAIILCPTRELCLQISQDMKKLAKYSKGVAITAVYGGERIDLQIRSLKRGTNIVVGTPGRVNDLIRRKTLKLQSIQWLVLDEADEMLDMGFKNELDAILEQTPTSRQTLLFSATMSKSVHFIAKKYMHDAQEISIGEKNVGAENITHQYHVVGARDRFEALKRILDSLPGVYGILFCRTRRETQEIADKLKQANYDTEALHGDISQSIRTKIMDRFKKKHIRLLVATDVAARGIDVSDLTHVINYNLPEQNEGYTHRSGRTGRAGNHGVSISIFSPKEVRTVQQLEKMIGKKFEYQKIPSGQDICKKQIDNFIQEIEKTDIAQLDDHQYIQTSIKKLNKIKKEDLIKHFITHKFGRLIQDYQNTHALNADTPTTNIKPEIKDSVSLKINFGKRHRFDIKTFFALINSNRNLQNIEIGRINLMPEYSTFSVAANDADEVINNLTGNSFRGKNIYVSQSENINSYPPNRDDRLDRGFGRKRRRF